MKKRTLVIRHVKTRKIARSFDVTDKSERYVEKLKRGLLTNMNQDEYFVDDAVSK